MRVKGLPLIAALAFLCVGATTVPGQMSPTSPPGVSALADQQTAPTIVPRHTIIPILVLKEQRVGAFGDAREEKKIKLEVAQDVIVAGRYIAKKGDLAEGHYTTERNVTKRMFSTNTSQELSLDIDDVVNFCGDTIHMEFERTFVGGGREGSFSFGPHAHDAVFDKGLVLKADTDRVEKSICAEPTKAAPIPLPSDMVIPDVEITPSPVPTKGSDD
jgi:hypothetical protein